MSEVVSCALCGAPVLAEHGPIELDGDGLPVALALVEGLGLPITDAPTSMLRVFCDDVELEHVVGFSRRLNRAWRWQKVDGYPLYRQGTIVIEQVCGEITLTAVSR